MHERVAPPDPPLHEGDIVLRPAREADLCAIAEEGADPELQRWLNIPVPYTPEAAQAYLDYARRTWEGPPSEGLAFTIADRATDEYLGGIILFVARHEISEVGYSVKPSARGRGVATRAVALVAHWAFRDLGVKRIELRTHLENRASQRVAEKAGFVREGVERKSRSLRGERYDVYCFSLLPEDGD